MYRAIPVKVDVMKESPGAATFNFTHPKRERMEVSLRGVGGCCEQLTKANFGDTLKYNGLIAVFNITT